MAQQKACDFFKFNSANSNQPEGNSMKLKNVPNMFVKLSLADSDIQESAGILEILAFVSIVNGVCSNMMVF